MSLNHSPSIVTNGLVFAYDMANTQKSFKGAPVTNSQWNNGSEVGPWTVNGVNTDVTGTSQQGPVANAKTWKFNKTGSSNQWNGWESNYGGIWTGSAGDIWTTSYWYKTSAPAGLSGFGIGSFYTSDWSRAYNTTVLSNVSSIIADGQWHYNYTTVQFNEAYSNAIIVDGPSWGYSTQVGELFINGLQWNKNNYATQFAAGTRSNTQALIDLTGKNTITATSLTYASDNTFSFNGSSDYIDVSGGGFVSGMTGYTICYWAKRTTGNRMPVAGRTSTAFYWYGDNSWAYTHGGTWGEYYYPKSVSIPDNTWGFFCCTYDGSNVKIYRNGVYEGQQATTGTVDWSQGMKIGYWSAGGGYAWSGNISGVNFYNRALSAAEVKQNFNALRGRYGL